MHACSACPKWRDGKSVIVFVLHQDTGDLNDESCESVETNPLSSMHKLLSLWSSPNIAHLTGDAMTGIKDYTCKWRSIYVNVNVRHC